MDSHASPHSSNFLAKNGNDNGNAHGDGLDHSLPLPHPHPQPHTPMRQFASSPSTHTELSPPLQYEQDAMDAIDQPQFNSDSMTQQNDSLSVPFYHTGHDSNAVSDSSMPTGATHDHLLTPSASISKPTPTHPKHESVRALLLQQSDAAIEMSMREDALRNQLSPDSATLTQAVTPTAQVKSLDRYSNSNGYTHQLNDTLASPPSSPVPESSQLPTSPLSSSAVAAAASRSYFSPAILCSRFMNSRLLGVSCLAISAVIFSLMSLLVSTLSETLPAFQIVWARCVIQFSCAAASCRFYDVKILGPRDRRPWLLLRGSLGFTGFTCYYYAMSQLTLADATTIFFTAPLYTGILGYLFLKERISKFDIACTLVSVCGVIMIVRPPFIFGADSGDGSEDSGSDRTSNTGTAHTAGVIAAIMGSLFSACVYIAIRKVGPGVHPLVLVGYMGLVGMFIAPLLSIIQPFELPPTAEAWLGLIGVGLISFIGQIFFNKGVQLEKAGPASMIRNLDVAFSFMWQITIQGIHPHTWSVIGAIIISASVVVMGVRKWKAEAKKERQRALQLLEPDDQVQQQQGPADVETGADHDHDTMVVVTLGEEDRQSRPLPSVISMHELSLARNEENGIQQRRHD